MFKFGKQMNPDRPIGLDYIVPNVTAQEMSEDDPMDQKKELEKESNIMI